MEKASIHKLAIVRTPGCTRKHKPIQESEKINICVAVGSRRGPFSIFEDLSEAKGLRGSSLNQANRIIDGVSLFYVFSFPPHPPRNITHQRKWRNKKETEEKGAILNNGPRHNEVYPADLEARLHAYFDLSLSLYKPLPRGESMLHIHVYVKRKINSTSATWRKPQLKKNHVLATATASQRYVEILSPYEKVEIFQIDRALIISNSRRRIIWYR